MSQKLNAKEEKKNKGPYGLQRFQWYQGLRLAWERYYNLSKEQVLDRKQI
jgi:hypothetical protein